MQLSTFVNIPPPGFCITQQEPILLLGSCFTDEIGARLQTAGFDCLCNPFGTLYNPFSIALCLQRAMQDNPIDQDCLVQHEGLWHSWLHHGRFSHPDRAQTLGECNGAIHATYLYLQRKPLVICTFGTAYAFFLNDPNAASAMQGQTVANCHKLPAGIFLRRRLSVEEVVERFQHSILDVMPLHFLFTVSPIRHLADGAHGNQLSKSTLLLAIDRLVQDNQCCHYFDSYEIVMDELRDYRFYSRDMCHLSEVAVDIVWERLQQTYMTGATRERVRMQEKQWRQQQHRPLHSSNE